MIEWLAPWGLAALAAVAIPLWLHIRRQPEAQAHLFAALRWIPLKTAPKQNMQWVERCLLLLRLSLLLVLALLLAQPRWWPKAEQRVWVGVAPGIRAAQLAQVQIPANANMHWLDYDFPAFQSTPPPTLPQVQSATSSSLASLIRQADADLPSEQAMQIIVPRQLVGMDAGDLALRHAVSWTIVEDPADARTVDDVPGALHLRAHVEAGDSNNSSYQVLNALVRRWQRLGKAVDLRPWTDSAAQIDSRSDAQTMEVWLAPPNANSMHADRVWVIENPQAARLAQAYSQSHSQPQPLVFDESGSAQLFKIREWTRRGEEVRMRWIYVSPTALNPQALPALLDSSFADQLFTALATPIDAPQLADAGAITPRQQAGTRPGIPWSSRTLLLWLALTLFLIERLWVTMQMSVRPNIRMNADGR